VPSVDGYTFLINNNDATDFGAGAGGPVFNQENVYINSFVNLITGNTTAAANFATTLGGATTLTAALTAVYNSMVPTVDQTEAGRTFFLSEASYYTARAAQVDLTSIVGQAAVGAAALANILVNNNVPGLGQEINQFLGAVANGSAAVPQSENFTPIATAIGTGETGGGGTTPPPAPTPTMALTVSGDTVHLNSTPAASTVSLSGADLTAFPSDLWHGGGTRLSGRHERDRQRRQLYPERLRQ
jgi:hypothetical protein